MEKKVFGLQQFSKYLNVSGVKDENIHIVHYANEKEQRLKSDVVQIDFYMLSIKSILHKNLIRQELWDDQSSSYIYFDSPHNSIEWDIEEPSTGYTLMVSSSYLNKVAKAYSFLQYTGLREALYLRKDKDILIGYIALLLGYTQTFYDRQFATRSKIYNNVVSDFYQNLKSYFSSNENVSGLPSVSYFAKKSFLSPNYFGDLVKHLTGKSPLEHIQDFIVDLARQKLQNTGLSISEISYSLGFDYPNYFARFFRKKTGLSPKAFRNQ